MCTVSKVRCTLWPQLCNIFSFSNECHSPISTITRRKHHDSYGRWYSSRPDLWKYRLRVSSTCSFVWTYVLCRCAVSLCLCYYSQATNMDCAAPFQPTPTQPVTPSLLTTVATEANSSMKMATKKMDMTKHLSRSTTNQRGKFGTTHCIKSWLELFLRVFWWPRWWTVASK